MQNKISCIAVDDEPLSLQQITGYIKKVDMLSLEETFENGIDALNYLKTHHVDLVFLDIQMDELTGVDLIESLNETPHFIFTTAYEHYALKAFELQAFDYLQKPLSFKRFMRAVDNFLEKHSDHMQKNSQDPENTTVPQENSKTESASNGKEFIFIKTKYKMQRLSFDDIYYIKGLNNYLILKTSNETIYTIQSFKNFSQILPPENFIRIHKSYIVAIDKIDVIGKNQVFIMGENIPIGESYKQYFFNYLTDKNLLFNHN